MKSLLKFLFFTALLFTVLVSCSKDDEDENTTETPIETGSRMTYEGTTYKLNTGFFLNFGQDTDPNDGVDFDGNNFDFYAYSEGVSVDYLSDVVYGNGFYLYIELFCIGEITPTQGDYTLNQSLDVSTFNYASITAIIDGEDGIEIEFTTGSINVTRDGSNYTVIGTLINANGNKLEVNYTGQTAIY